MSRQATGQVIVREGKRGRTFALRYRVPGVGRQYETLGSEREGWTDRRAEEELENRRAAIRLGVWQPPRPEPVPVAHEEPTFHEFASEWVASHRLEVGERTVEFWMWALSEHLLPYFSCHRPSEITSREVDRYRTAKLTEREARLAALARWQREEPERRGTKPPRPLSNGSINKTLVVLARVLDDAIEDETIPVTANAARGRRRRLKAAKPRRTWLELDEVGSVLDAAGAHRALIATMILAGLRVGELCSLRWRAVDLARGALTVEASKTEAGEGRKVDLTPMLLSELKRHRADHATASGDDLVFATSTGGQRDRHNIRSRILLPAIERANKARAKAGLPPIGDGITNHACRRTFASLLYEAGASPAYVMSQMGHASSALALEVYAKKMQRQRDTGERIDALVRAADWAQTGTNEADSLAALPSMETGEVKTPLG